MTTLIRLGMVVGLGSDFNPNAYCLAMPVVMHLACVNLRMSLAESLAAATINSAHSLGRSETHGSLEVTVYLAIDRNFHNNGVQGRESC